MPRKHQKDDINRLTKDLKQKNYGQLSKMKEDKEFAKRTEEAWKRYEKGEFKTMDFDEFIKEMKKW